MYFQFYTYLHKGKEKNLKETFKFGKWDLNWSGRQAYFHIYSKREGPLFTLYTSVIISFLTLSFNYFAFKRGLSKKLFGSKYKALATIVTCLNIPGHVDRPLTNG